MVLYSVGTMSMRIRSVTTHKTKTPRAVDLQNLKTDDGAPRVDRLKQL